MIFVIKNIVNYILKLEIKTPKEKNKIENDKLDLDKKIQTKIKSIKKNVVQEKIEISISPKKENVIKNTTLIMFNIN